MHAQKTAKPRKLPFTDEQIRTKAYQISQQHPERSPDENWDSAIKALNHERLFQPFIKSFQGGEGLKQFINFFWKTLPTSDWVKVFAAPVIIGFFGGWIANTFQEQSKQNDIVSKYFERMEKIIVEKKLDISKNETPAKALIKGESLFTLRSIDIKRREALINFLSEYGLLNRSKNGISLGYFDLTKVNLSGLNLIHIDLNHAILPGAILKGADLRSADLSVANLNGANLYAAKLYGAKLIAAKLRSADLTSADLRSADLSVANLNGAKLNSANLRSADLSNANLSNANLSNANLTGADLTDADFTGADFTGADLTGAKPFLSKQIKSAKNWERARYNHRLLKEEYLKDLDLMLNHN